MNRQSQLAYQPLPEQNLWQNHQLQVLLQYLQDRSPYYKKLLGKHHVDIHNIRSLHDLSFLPTTCKDDMQQHNWDFLCVPDHEVREYTATSGTLGKPVTIALTENDLRRLAYNEQQSFLTTGAKSSDIFQLMLTLDRQFMAGMAYYLGLRELGAAVVRTGAGFPSLQWDTIQRLQANSLVAVPSFLLKMIAYANEAGIDLKNSPVEKVLCIGEGLRTADFEPNTLAQRITSQWNIKLFGTYASTEMQTAFTECEAGMGGHHLPELVIFEILDDQGNPLREGEYGELTITTLGVEGMPLLRYRTGDICCYYDAPCSCGRKSRRLSPVLGRKQQMIKYKGTTLYPPAIFELLNSQDYIKEYQVEVTTDALGMDDLQLHLFTDLTDEQCSNRLRPLLQSRLRVAPQLNYCSAEQMQLMQFPQASRKQVKFVDNRNADY